MKVYNLRCAHEHAFEGWFASEDEFAAQQGKRLIACPLCGDADVIRMPSAPRLNLGAGDAPPAIDPPSATSPQALQAQYLQLVRTMLDQAEDVGDRFAEEARKIHYDEAPARHIRGQATRDDAVALREEGIEVFALPVPAALKEPLQ